MAQLKSTIVQGNLRVTDTTFLNTIQTQILIIPTSTNGSTYGAGTNGQVIRTNGTSIFWHTLIPSDIGAWAKPASIINGSAIIASGTNGETSLVPILNNTVVSSLGWTSTSFNNTLINLSTLAYWNGAYSDTSSNLSILGTVTTGTWNATTIGVGYGGTGATTLANARANLGTWALVSDSYNTLMSADGTTNAWIKIGTANTSYGLLPSQTGGSGSGHNYIGTSSWYWKYAYIDEIYGHLNGNITGTAASISGIANNTIMRTYTREEVGDTPNYDNPGFNGVFEVRASSETPNATGTNPGNGWYPMLTLNAPNTLFQLAGVNDSFWIRGMQGNPPTLTGIPWQRIALADSNGIVTIAKGGTGATTAAGARSNLGLGSAATFNVGSGYLSTTYIPAVNAGTTLEIGPIIDFHITDGTNEDYAIRLGVDINNGTFGMHSSRATKTTLLSTDTYGNTYFGGSITSEKYLWFSTAASGNGTNNEISPGIYWNSNVESANDSSDGAAICQIYPSSITGGTELKIYQQNDASDIINICAPAYIYLNNKKAFSIYDTWLRINEDTANAFASGVYFGGSTVRTDGRFEVGASGGAFSVDANGIGYFANNLYFAFGASIYVRHIMGYGRGGEGTNNDLFLQYGQNANIYLGNTASYCITADGGTYTGTAAQVSGSGVNYGAAFWALNSTTENQVGVTYSTGNLYFVGKPSDTSSSIYDTRAGFVIARDTSNDKYNFYGQAFIYPNSGDKIYHNGTNWGIYGSSPVGIFTPGGAAQAIQAQCIGLGSSYDNIDWSYRIYSKGHSLLYSLQNGGNAWDGAAIEIREVNLVGASQSAYSYAPRIGFHWSARVQGQFGLESDAVFRLRYGDDASNNLAPLQASSVYGAVWNDYAEYRDVEIKEPGRCVQENDNGHMTITQKRLIPGSMIISDTYGFAEGETEICNIPIAVAGRVLAYTYQDKNKYHAGQAVCSAPNGTIDIMTREEIQQYPDAIIGIVSEIPNYEEWGSGKVKVNGRIWIKVK